jgi:hypothetical protein
LATPFLLLLLLPFSGCSSPMAPTIRYEWLDDHWADAPGGRYVRKGADYRFDDGVILPGIPGR